MPYVNKDTQQYYQREYYLDNKDVFKDKCLWWRELNKERSKALRRKYYLENKDKEYKRKQEWRRNNKERNNKSQRKTWKKHKDFYNCIRRLQNKLDKIYGVKKR